MKRIFIISVLVFAFLLSLISCGKSIPQNNKSPNEEENDPKEPEQEEGIRVVPSMASNNYFDVSNFVLQKMQGGMLLEEVVNFSYIPVETRFGGLYESVPWEGTFAVDEYQVDNMLQSLHNTSALRVIPFSQDGTDSLWFGFLQQYGCAYSLHFIHNIEREYNEKGDYEPKNFEEYHFYISPKTEIGTYFVLDEAQECVYECAGEDFVFLELSAFDWRNPEIFDGSIAFLKTVEIYAANGIDALNGVNDVTFYIDNSASDEWVGSSENLIVTADYGTVLGKEIDAYQFRLFYQFLLGSWLEGEMPAETEAWQEDCKTAGDSMAQLVIRMTYYTDHNYNETITRVYRFYPQGGSNCFVTVNGEGTDYMLQSRVNKIISNTGKVLFAPQGGVIDPEIPY
ncbi:MAG: hypothetical protein IKM08_06965 [Clostridia bacterium]|nr:hypothetical protein [Clostridia bacterium]